MSNAAVDTSVKQAMRSWGDAELNGDFEALRSMLSEDFAGIGPHGFQLGKAEWLQRYESGDLVNESFNVEESAVRDYGNVAIVNGVQVQQSAYQGHFFPGKFRLTAVLNRDGEDWRIVNVQLSTMMDE